MRTKFILRTRLLALGFILAALLLLVRLYFVQIVHGADYEQDAVAQYVEANPDTIARGSIFFTDKNHQVISAAIMQAGWRIAIKPKDLIDPAATYSKISAIVPLDHDRFFSSAAKLDDPYEEVALHLTDAQADAIRTLKLPGILLVADQWRFYPGHELAAQALGFLGYSGTSTVKIGVYGLEKSWQDTLQFTGSELYVNPFAEIFSNLQAAVSTDPSAHEGSIITSIDPSVQQQLEATLDEVMKQYTPDLAGGIVMDPHTGDIYAIAGRPTFDPNTYNVVTDPSVYRDPMVEGRYELGSIMKPLTMAAGIDSGAVTAATTYNDTGCITVSTYKVCNWDLKARGVIPMQRILDESLNVGASFVATKTGYPTFTRYMQAYGFGERTNIDLPNEVPGDLSPLGNGTLPAVNYDTASFGQGIAVSPIEMVRALSALANGGVLPNPHVVTAVRYETGITRAIDVGQGRRVLSTTTASTVTDMLVHVYDTQLLHGEIKMDHYSVAAKTGTAQIPDPVSGGYLKNIYLHSFFGYFPAHDPRFIVFLFTIKPHGQEYASATLARPFYDIARFLINYYNLPPDR